MCAAIGRPLRWGGRGRGPSRRVREDPAAPDRDRASRREPSHQTVLADSSLGSARPERLATIRQTRPCGHRESTVGSARDAAAALPAAAQGAPLIFGHAAPDASVLIGLQRPLQARGAYVASLADRLGALDLGPMGKKSSGSVSKHAALCLQSMVTLTFVCARDTGIGLCVSRLASGSLGCSSGAGLVGGRRPPCFGGCGGRAGRPACGCMTVPHPAAPSNPLSPIRPERSACHPSHVSCADNWSCRVAHHECQDSIPPD